MSGGWTTVSSYTEKVEDENPQVWYDAAFAASTWEEALYYYEKGEYYYKLDMGYEYPDRESFLKTQLYIQFHGGKIFVCIGLMFFILCIFSTFINQSQIGSQIKQSLTDVLSNLAHYSGMQVDEFIFKGIFLSLLLSFTFFQLWKATEELKFKERIKFIMFTVGFLVISALVLSIFL